MSTKTVIAMATFYAISIALLALSFVATWAVAEWMILGGVVAGLAGGVVAGVGYVRS